MQETNLHITSCLHPLRVRNKFTNEMVTVPCGKCSACTSKRAYIMEQRLNMERLSWKYCLFVTLTYDNDHLPLLTQPEQNVLIDVNPKRIHPIKGVKLVPVVDELHKIHCATSTDLVKTKQFIELQVNRFGGLPYLSSVDIQRFIKRLRITFERKYKSYELQEKNPPSIRYFACGEYGPTTFRPHYHLLLFFSSQFLAAYIQEYIRECWKYGFTDTSFVSECNSSYVASYVNSVAHLPAIYQTASLRPFALFSKHPALGTLAFDSDNLKEQFKSCDITQTFLYSANKLPLTVPLWRTLQNRLYPQLPYYSEISDLHLRRLYGFINSSTFQNSDRTFGCFVQCAKLSNSDYIKTYIQKMNSVDGDLINKFYRWYTCCLVIKNQSQIFDIPYDEYVDTVIRFYKSKEHELLNSQYRFQQQYAEKHDICEMIGLDKQFWDSLSSCILAGYDMSDLDATEISYLKQFTKLDLDSLFNDDISVRQTYIAQLEFEMSDEYLAFKSAKDLIYENSTKTKKKYDYLLAQSDVEYYSKLSCF